MTRGGHQGTSDWLAPRLNNSRSFHTSTSRTISSGTTTVVSYDYPPSSPGAPESPERAASVTATPTVEPHVLLTNPVSRHLDQFIHTSQGLSLAAFASSMVTLGTTSVYLTEVGFGLTMIHHGVLCYKRSREIKLCASGQWPPETLPASSVKVNIYAVWCLAFVWIVALGVVSASTAVIYGDSSDLRPEERKNRSIATPFELGCLVLEVCLMVTIGLWCKRERRLLLEELGIEK